MKIDKSRIILIVLAAALAIALAVQAISGVSHTPFNSQKGVSTNRNPMGNTSVPKKDVSSDRPGRSSAVK